MSDTYLELTTDLAIDGELSVTLVGGVPPHDEPVIIEKEVTANGVYKASDDEADGYSKVTVDVNIPQPTLIEKSVSVNGTYNAIDDEADGYSSVTVDVPAIVPTLIEKSITDNGTYLASSDSADGYSKVTVDVEPNLTTKSITENGTYNASSDNADGYSQVTVDVQPTLTTKSITENGTYNAASDNADGYSSVTVDIEPDLIEKSVTENGVYNASSDNADGYSKFTVAVPPTYSVTFTPVVLFQSSGIGAESWSSSSQQDTIIVNGGTYTPTVGEYVTVDSTNQLRMSFSTDSSYYAFGIKCKVNSNFTPVATNNWYQASCILGQELPDAQRDYGIIIDRNGYFALGWAANTITSSTVSALDNKVHELFMLATNTQIKLIIDGNEEVSVDRIMAGNNMSYIGIFWNKDNQNTRVNGEIYSVGRWSYTITNSYDLPDLL